MANAGLFGGLGPVGYVNSLYAPVQAQLAQQQQARTDTLNQLVGSILQNLRTPQPDVYGAAAQDAVSAANGAAQTLQRVNPDAQTQAMLRAIGAPQAQQAQVGQQNQNTFGGGAALDQYVGGALPAGMFAQDQAARNTYLNSLPAIVGQSAIQGLGRLNLLASQENSKLGAQKASDTLKAQNELANYVQKNQSLKLNQQKQAFNQAATQARLNQGQQRLDLTSQMDAFNQKYKIANLNLASQKFAQTTLNQNRSYQLQLKRIGISQRNLQLRTIQDEYKLQNGGFTPIEINKFKTSAFNIAGNAFGGFTDTKGKVYPPVNYQQAVKEMRSSGVPLSIAIPALAAAGYKPGVRGTPFANNGTQSFDFGGSVGQLTRPLAVSGLAGGFLPRGATVTLKRTDQGRDIQTTPNSPIIAPGAGYVVRIASDPGGGGAHFGPSYPIVHFTTGPYAGQTMYIGHTVAQVRPGQTFGAGDVLSLTGNGGPEAGGAPPGWAEIGFAPNGVPGALGQKAPF